MFFIIGFKKRVSEPFGYRFFEEMFFTYCLVSNSLNAFHEEQFDIVLKFCVMWQINSFGKILIDTSFSHLYL